METVYIYGGYILTGGTLQNGNAWKGINIMLAETKVRKDGYELPVVAKIAKASRPLDGSSNAILDFCQDFPSGTYCHAYFSLPDSNGRVKLVKIEPVEN